MQLQNLYSASIPYFPPPPQKKRIDWLSKLRVNNDNCDLGLWQIVLNMKVGIVTFNRSILGIIVILIMLMAAWTLGITAYDL